MKYGVQLPVLRGAHSAMSRAAVLVVALLGIGALPRDAAAQAATGRLAVTVTDGGTGEPTAFRARITDGTRRVDAVPEQATAVMYGQRDEARGYAAQPDGAFYVDGRFDLDLPAGRYRLTISKGHEYLRQQHEVEIRSGESVSRDVRLLRWVDMPAEGWYSVDDHIHLRRSPRENPLILTWLAAEDIHVGALLQMGDYHHTAFAQYAWGRDGVYQLEDRMLTTGQEDPRTHEIGHTISLGADRFVRSREHYYEYDHTFDQVHEHGGITGYAHQGVLNSGYRGLTLDVLADRVDFMEVLQFCGDVQPPLNTEHYYHFLDLGFRLTATAGSDFPWCGRSNGPQIGNARFYTHIDGELSFEEWLDSVRAGHTVVSSGPMLELTVDDRIPGQDLPVEPGSRLRVRARARGHREQVPLRDLEIVVHGEVVRRVEAGDGGGQNAEALSLEFELPVEHGFWIAARVHAGPEQFAHTTPIYVTTGSGFHNPATVMERLDRSEGYLREIEQELAGPRHDRIRNAWRFGCDPEEPGCIGDALRKRIEETRRTIIEMRERFTDPEVAGRPAYDNVNLIRGTLKVR